MKLPKAIEYHQAMQNPQVHFTEPDLKRGVVKRNQLGTPAAASGGFALTYAITAGGQEFAVRCFQKLGPQLQQRYAAIGYDFSQ